METICVTGAGGLAGVHLVRRLVDRADVKELRLVDRNLDAYASCVHPKLRLFPVDLCQAGEVERALRDCTTVIHMAKSKRPIGYGNKEETRAMWRDNLDATEILTDCCVSLRVRRLIHVGDAYANLPVDDNYGISEDMHRGYPSSYLSGEYGESRTRAEMYARQAVEREAKSGKDDPLNAVFLRPVHVYGEGKSDWIDAAVKAARDGTLPYFDCTRRGQHQFLYAGNLAGIILAALDGLQKHPVKLNGEVVFCMDTTYVSSMREFLSEYASTERYSPSSSVNFFSTMARLAFTHIKYKCGIVDPAALNLHYFRVMLEKTVGFSNRKLRLLLDYTPDMDQEKAMAASLAAFHAGPAPAIVFDANQALIDPAPAKQILVRKPSRMG